MGKHLLLESNLHGHALCIDDVYEYCHTGVVQPSDEAFERLLEVTGAASLDDTASVNPAINLGYPGTGATPLMAAAGHGRLTEVSLCS